MFPQRFSNLNLLPGLLLSVCKHFMLTLWMFLDLIFSVLDIISECIWLETGLSLI